MRHNSLNYVWRLAGTASLRRSLRRARFALTTFPSSVYDPAGPSATERNQVPIHLLFALCPHAVFLRLIDLEVSGAEKPGTVRESHRRKPSFALDGL